MAAQKTMIETEIQTYSIRAMATIFEIALWGKPESYLQSVAEEAFEEIRRIEGQLSIYRDDTEIFEANAVAAKRDVALDPRIFQFMLQATALSVETAGAFDFTVGPLLRAWGFIGDAGHPADPEAVEWAKSVTGVQHLIFNTEYRTIRFDTEGVMLDLGAIGKGYALDVAAEFIRDMEVPGGLIHGGTSSVVAIGGQPDGSPWTIAIQDPTDESTLLTTVDLLNETLSVSAVHGKYFEDDGIRFGHVIDSRTGSPTQNAVLAVVVCDSATEGDAFSTALIVDGLPFLDILKSIRPDARALVAVHSKSGLVVHNHLQI